MKIADENMTLMLKEILKQVKNYGGMVGIYDKDQPNMNTVEALKEILKLIDKENEAMRRISEGKLNEERK